ELLSCPPESAAPQAPRIERPGQQPHPEAVEPAMHINGPCRREPISDALEAVPRDDPVKVPRDIPAAKGRLDAKRPDLAELRHGLQMRGQPAERLRELTA